LPYLHPSDAGVDSHGSGRTVDAAGAIAHQFYARTIRRTESDALDAMFLNPRKARVLRINVGAVSLDFTSMAPSSDGQLHSLESPIFVGVFQRRTRREHLVSTADRQEALRPKGEMRERQLFVPVVCLSIPVGTPKSANPILAASRYRSRVARDRLLRVRGRGERI
jgi:hypothetical protein